jgi:hypothetical protein
MNALLPQDCFSEQYYPGRHMPENMSNGCQREDNRLMATNTRSASSSRFFFRRTASGKETTMHRKTERQTGE